jgi:orotidine-5'-phosphate decarboxylase
MGEGIRGGASERLIVALDIEGFEAAKHLIDELMPVVGGFAIGYMAMAEGWDRHAVDHIRQKAEKRVIFYDPHLNATPRITAAAVAAYSRWGITHLSVCGTAGQQSIRAAVEHRGPIEIVVTTVLTSFDENDIRCEYGRRSDEVVSEHARAANLAGAQALLCSPQELKIIREYTHVERLTKIVNGIRFRDFPLKKDDFQRILSPGEAIRAGADYLLVGRPIVEPPAGIKSPRAAVERIIEEINSALPVA